MKNPLRMVAASLVLGAFWATAFAQNRTFTNQYTFGDSLSDNGNAFLASGRTINTNPLNFGGRWSNGPTFVEQLGNNLAVGSAAPASVKTSMDFAFGGATAVPALSAVPFPSLPVQLQIFQSHAVAIQRTDLFTVWIGANDILNTAAQANPAAMAPAGINAAQATANAIQSLINLGAKNILVVNMPDIGLTPAGLSSGGGSLLTAGSLAYNAEFDSRLRAITSGAPDVTLTRIDAAALIARIQVDFRALGFANATSGIILPGGGGGDPSGFAFFDGIHPSATTHALLARVVTEALNPEPVIGFAATEGTAALALQSLATSAIDSRLAQLATSGRAVGRADAYASFKYGTGNRVADGLRPKFDYDAQVVTAGVDGRIRDGVTVGGALDTARLVAKVSAGRGGFTLEDQAGRLYGQWRGGPIAFSIDANYGVASVKGAHRTTAFGGFQSNGKTSGTHWGVGAKATWTVDAGGLNLRPWLGLRMERVKLGAYTERDVPSLSMAFAAQEAKSSAGGVGLDLGTDTMLVEHALHFDFSAAWHGEYRDRTRGVAGQLANNFTRPTTVNVTDGDGSGFQLGAAATLLLNKKWSATLGYSGDIRPDDKLASRIVLSVQSGF
ncbi:MAG: autotransporter domain-containing protein [Verrucomicrobia bacterium]|nr:autotransporter domain-containing protein [Verrucomicrobiota bacterium]